MTQPDFEFLYPDFPLAPQTTYRVGGSAAWALVPRTGEDMVAAYAWLAQYDGPRLIMGGGSNLLIPDEGFPGAVLITTAYNDIERTADDRFTVASGHTLAKLVSELMVPNNYTGVGGLTGIPGSVGGAMYMNAGTVNGSICQLLESVELVDADGVHTVAIDDTMYSYRGQTFCTPRTLILSGHFVFSRDPDDQRAVFNHYMARRNEKQPQGFCCGSVFKNPAGEHAGRLIESCGLKGQRHGGAVISEKHANFILNDNHATCADILALITLCKERVLQETGILLEEEVRILGVNH